MDKRRDNNLTHFLWFAEQVAQLKQLVANCPDGVHFALLQTPEINIGQYKGIPETAELWFLADQPTSLPEIEPKFRLIYNSLAEYYIVVKYRIGFKLEGQPGVVRTINDNRELFPDLNTTPGMAINLIIGLPN